MEYRHNIIISEKINFNKGINQISKLFHTFHRTLAKNFVSISLPKLCENRSIKLIESNWTPRVILTTRFLSWAWCLFDLGKPKPRVTWLLESQTIDAPSEIRESQGPGGEANVVTISNVTLKGLTRSHYHAKLLCKANNTHLAPPPTTAVVIELHSESFIEICFINLEQRTRIEKGIRIIDNDGP